MTIQIIGTVFKKSGEYGDFDYMIKSGKYENSLFIFNDNEKHHTTFKEGGGNAIIRKYNKFALPDKPRSAGIVTGQLPIMNGGYKSFSNETKIKIDMCIDEIKKIITENKYQQIFYSADEENGLLGTSIFKVNEDVIKYITNQIKNLANYKI